MTRPQVGRSGREVATVVANRAKERMADPRAVWGLPWPFTSLNTLTGGIHQSEMTVATARPSVGKTQFMVHVADAVAQYLRSEQGLREHPDEVVKLVLCESTAEVFMQRWACIRAGVSARKVMDGSIRNNPEQADRFIEELRAIARMPIKYLDEPESLDQIVRFLDDGPTAWWALDHIQVCPYMPGRPNDNSITVLTPIANTLSEVAKKVAPGLVLAHTPRDVDKREDKRPMMGDIKGSSAIEGAARVVLGMYTERIYKKVPPEEANKPYIVEVQILKNNNVGRVGSTVDLLFHARSGVFEDVSDLTGIEED